MMFGQRSLFDTFVCIPSDIDIVFVSDFFVSDYAGGAEMTTQALIDSSPFKVFTIHSRDVTIDTLRTGIEKYWIFGNFSMLDQSLFPTIIANMRYSVIEYDFKYCKYRSMLKHAQVENNDCTCNNSDHGKQVSAFLYGAKSLWWMSEKQLEHYCNVFPFIANSQNAVLSSVFDDSALAVFNSYHASKDRLAKNDKRLIVRSNHWGKGTNDAIEHCVKHGLSYELVDALSYDELLMKLMKSRGLVFLPKGEDTCPRLVIEAKLLGCELIINDNVLHRHEQWFETDDIELMLSYLYAARSRFWNGIKCDIACHQTLSGYTTTLNCIIQRYPFVSSIMSMVGFCDEVIVLDGGSTDGTWEKLCDIASKNASVRVYKHARDWKDPRFAIFDGQQKALARSLCTSMMCWQMDVDEIVLERDYDKVKALVRTVSSNNVELFALPIVEFWGSRSKVRIDVNPWKWRLSKNSPVITHGVPAGLRRYDDQGQLYSAHGSDGCDYVRLDTYAPIQFMTFYTADIHGVRARALSNDESALRQYGEWYARVIDEYPTVYHFSWFDIERKIRTYRDYWTEHWNSLYNEQTKQNMFFGCEWSDVDDQMIKQLAIALADECGGHVFHTRWDPCHATPWITLVSNDICMPAELEQQTC